MPIVIVCHFDADGLSAAALLTPALVGEGRAAEPLLIGKGETPWDEAVRDRIADRRPGGVVLGDPGTRAEPVLAGVATVVIDHHVPTGTPGDAVTISGNGCRPNRRPPCSPGGPPGRWRTRAISCGSPPSA